MSSNAHGAVILINPRFKNYPINPFDVEDGERFLKNLLVKIGKNLKKYWISSIIMRDYLKIGITK